METLWQRANLLKASIVWASASVLLAALLIIFLFIGTLLHWDITVVVVLLFCGCLATVIVSLLYFVKDIVLSLHALRLDLDS